MKAPEDLTIDHLIVRWPTLFHMAEAGSWPSIQKHGLRSTAALLDLFEVQGDERYALESQRRQESVKITHAEHGTAWIRDNKPIIRTVLKRTLTGMDEATFYKTLNSRVFFWLTQARLVRLMNAPPYRNRQHDVLVVDTAGLMGRYGDVVELSPMNSGATHPAANYPRGVGTFSRIGEYPWKARKAISPSEPIVEVTVPYAIPDISDFVLEVRERAKA